MKPIILNRNRPHIKSTTLSLILSTIKTAKQREIVLFLLQRYGTSKVKWLLPEQVSEFTEELHNVLNGKAPHPADSILP